jgi:hypothetical protein
MLVCTHLCMSTHTTQVAVCSVRTWSKPYCDMLWCCVYHALAIIACSSHYVAAAALHSWWLVLLCNVSVLPVAPCLVSNTCCTRTCMRLADSNSQVQHQRYKVLPR